MHTLSHKSKTSKSSKTSNHQGTTEPAKTPSIQPKLTVGEPNDKYEREADQVADKVMAMPEPGLIQRKCASCESEDKKVQKKALTPSITPWVQKQEEEETEEPTAEPIQKQQEEELQPKIQLKSEKEEDPNVQLQPEIDEEVSPKLQLKKEDENPDIQTKRTAPNSGAGSSIESSLKSSKGGGSPLPDDTRSFMESRIGADFSKVKVHTDSSAVQMNKELNAQAFTHGNDVYFNQGKYNPDSSSGKHLLAHELTHTVQQGKSQKVQRKTIQRQERQPSPAERYNEDNHDFTPGMVWDLYLISGSWSLWSRTIKEGRMGPEFVLLVKSAQRALGIKATGILEEETIKLGIPFIKPIRQNRARHGWSKGLLFEIALMVKNSKAYQEALDEKKIGPAFVRLIQLLQKRIGVDESGILDDTTIKAAIAVRVASNALTLAGIINRLDADTFDWLSTGKTKIDDSQTVINVFSHLDKQSGEIDVLLKKLQQELEIASLATLIDKLFQALVFEQEVLLARILLAAGIKDGVLKRITPQIFTGDSLVVREIFQNFSGPPLSTILKAVNLAINDTRETAIWLFGRLELLDAEKVRIHFLESGSELGEQLAIDYTVYKIEELISGYTSVADSYAILYNFKRTPIGFRGIVYDALNIRTQKLWKEDADETLSKDMTGVPYMMLRELLSEKKLRKQSLVWEILNGLMGIAEWPLVVLEVITGGLIGIATGIWQAAKEIVEGLTDISMGVYHVLMVPLYFMSQGKVGSESYAKVMNFLEGIGEMIMDPGGFIKTAWDDFMLESELIEGPFAYGKKAELWVRRLAVLIIDVVTIVKGAAKIGVKSIKMIKKFGRTGLRGVRKLIRAAGGKVKSIFGVKFLDGKHELHMTPKGKVYACSVCTSIKGKYGDHIDTLLDEVEVLAKDGKRGEAARKLLSIRNKIKNIPKPLKGKFHIGPLSENPKLMELWVEAANDYFKNSRNYKGMRHDSEELRRLPARQKRYIYNQVRKKFWKKVYENKEARELIESTPYKFQGPGKTPVIPDAALGEGGVGGFREFWRRMSIDHETELRYGGHPTDPTNLVLQSFISNWIKEMKSRF